MTASELRELDAWIEEHLFGREVVIQDREDLPTIYKFKLEYEYVPVHAYSSSVVAFALVKREIERRGWEWSCSLDLDRAIPKVYTFIIYTDKNDDEGGAFYGHSEDSEELAGCLAVKAAVEGNNAHPD